ncbi:MAG: response regulator [Chloroflexota bacterium]|nr:response regulator [Chloroflexota bacterium]
MTDTSATLLALIIEDDDMSSDIFSITLRDAGYATEVIKNGEAALARLAQVMPHVVTLDINLPRVSGLQIYEYIRSQEHLQRTWVVIVSANAYQASTIDETKDERLFKFLKPISVAQLKRLVTALREEK